MSRSYRLTPIAGMTYAASNKNDKRIANRALRRNTKVLLKRRQYDNRLLPVLKAISNRRDFSVWGKHYIFTPLQFSYLRQYPYTVASKMAYMRRDLIRLRK